MKALKVIRSVAVWLMILLAACMMIFTIVSVSTFDRADRSLFGYKAFIVLSDSMSKTDFDDGDLVLVKEVDPITLQEGDIIAYTWMQHISPLLLTEARFSNLFQVLSLPMREGQSKGISWFCAF